jgi:hypothetical protein
MRVAHEQNLSSCRMCAGQRCAGGLRRAEGGRAAMPANAGLDHGHHRLPGARLLRAGQRALDPGRQEIQAVFADPGAQDEDRRCKMKISGCINACGHHHVGHIGILGVDKKGEEFYQVLFGGRADEKATIATIQGPGLKHEEVAPAIRRVIDTYLSLRRDGGEKFIDTMSRVGQAPFKEALYAAA